MELYEYIKPLRKWWWLLIIAPLVAGVSSYVATQQELPIFESRTTLLIGRTIDDPNPTSGQFQLAQQLATSYADIANRERIRVATMESLGISWLPEYLARALPNTQLIEIVVTDSDPVRAQAVAQELANQLVLSGPTSSDPEEIERQEFIAQQLDDIERQIQETQDEITTQQAALGELTSAREIADTRSQILTLENKLTNLQRSYGTLLSNAERGATNILTVIEPANLPGRPINENKVISIASAAAIGLVLAGAAAYTLEYLDKSIKSPEEAQRIFNTQVIGYIAEISEQAGHKPYVAENPRSTVAEAFRSLRTNLEFAAVEQPLETIFITSATPDAGKTSVAVNLAIIIAQGGKKVILLDGDLRRPNIHGYLGIANNNGLVDVFHGDLDIHDSIIPWEDDRLSIITAGAPPTNPAELLGSSLMDKILEEVKELADIVIIDGPPFVVADASILSSKVDGILVVIRPGHTNRNAAQSMAEQIDRIGARVLGITLNRIPKGSADYYGRYWYYSPEYSSPYTEPYDEDDEAIPVQTNGRKKFSGRFGSRRKDAAKADSDQPILATEALETGDLAEAGRRAPDKLGGPPLTPAPPKACAVLRWVDNVGKRQKLVLREGDTILIGRDRINDVIIQSRHVSRRHAVITWRNGSYEIADLGSTNGTYINGVAADRPLEMNDGDKVRLFDVEIEFQTLNSKSENNVEAAGEQEINES